MPVKVFVSWSGDKSFSLAERLVEWLPTIVPGVRVFYSSDIGGGYLWLNKLLQELTSAKFGIVCVSKENQRSQWLHFEVGALWQRAGKDIPVCPLLLDLSTKDLTGPLAFFQAREFNEHGLRSLCADTAKKAGLDDTQFRRNFKAAWTQIETELGRNRRRRRRKRGARDGQKRAAPERPSR